MATKRLNKNLVVALTLFTFAAMIGLAVIMLSQLQKRDPIYFYDLAEKARVQSQWPQAALFYREAYARSQDAAYLVYFGEMMLNDGEVRNALGAWQQALINQPDLLDAHVKLIDLLTELAQQSGNLSRWERLREAADHFIEVDVEKTSQQQAMAHHAKGLALIRLKNQDESYVHQGIEELESAARLSPETVDYSIDLARQYVSQEREDDGQRLLQDLVTRHTSPGADSSKVRLAYAKYLVDVKQIEEAEPLFTESLSLAQGNPDALYDARLGYAVFLSQKWGRTIQTDESSDEVLFDEAQSILQNNIRVIPDRYEAYVQLSMLYNSAKRYEDVVNICENRLKRGLTRKGVEASHHRLYTFSLMIQAAQACVSQGLQLSLDGDVQAKNRWMQRAEQYVIDAKGEFPNHPRVVSQSGRIKVAKGEFRDALEDLRAAEEGYRSFDSINWENKIILARIHLRLNEAGAARDLLEEVVQQARRLRSVDLAFWVVYAQALLQTDSQDRALTIVDRVLRVHSEYADAIRLKAAILDSLGRHQQAGEFFGDATVLAILTAKQLTMEGNSEGAINELRQALKNTPTDVRLVSALVTELINLDRKNEASEVVQNARQLNPDDMAIQKLEVYVRTDLSDEQRDIAMLEVIESQTDAYKRNLDLIAHYTRTNDPLLAIRAINEAEKHLIASDTPLAQNTTLAHHRALLRTKIQLAFQLEDNPSLEEARDNAKKYNVDGSDGKSILGYYHMAHKEIDLAINAFREAIREQPTDTWTLSHLGQCMQMAKRNDEARNIYERALQINPNEGMAHKGLAFLARSRNDDQAYHKHLDRCEQLNPNDVWVQEQLLARREQEDPRGAIQRRITLLEKRPDDMDNIRRLAGLYKQVGEQTNADRYYDLWIEKNPDDKATILWVSDYYRKTERPERSLEIVTQYTDTRSTSAEKANAHILIANHFVVLQELDRAEDVLLLAARQKETVELTFSLAELYLKTLKEPQKAIPWLNRSVEMAKEKRSPLLAQILLTRINCHLDRALNDTTSARKDVDEFTQHFPNDPRYLLLDSEIYARQGRMDQAISSLSDYLNKRPGDLKALFNRAKHYIAQGKLGSSIEDLQSIARKNPLALNLEPRILLSNLYGRRGQKDLWIRELESLVQDAPDSGIALEVLVNAYIKESRPEDADRLVTMQINQNDHQPDAKWFFLRGRISLLLGHFDQAIVDYQRAVELLKHSPKSILRILDIYIRAKRYNEGLIYFQKHAIRYSEHTVLLSRKAILLALNSQPEKSMRTYRSTLVLALQKIPESIPDITVGLQLAFQGNSALNDAINQCQSDVSIGLQKRANEIILVRLYRLTNRFTDAIQVIEGTIRTSNNSSNLARLYQEKAELHQIAGDPENARRAYESALEYDKQNWMTLNNLAYILVSELGEPAAALQYAQEAVKIDENPASLDTLGWIYATMENYDHAIAELSRAIRLNPNQALALYHLGEVYRRADRFNDAITILESGKLIAVETNDQDMIARIDQATARTRSSDNRP